MIFYSVWEQIEHAYEPQLKQGLTCTQKRPGSNPEPWPNWILTQDLLDLRLLSWEYIWEKLYGPLTFHVRLSISCILTMTSYAVHMLTCCLMRHGILRSSSHQGSGGISLYPDSLTSLISLVAIISSQHQASSVNSLCLVVCSGTLACHLACKLHLWYSNSTFIL